MLFRSSARCAASRSSTRPRSGDGSPNTVISDEVGPIALILLREGSGPILHLLEADARARHAVLIEVGGAGQREAPRRDFKAEPQHTVYGGFRVDRDGVQVAHKRLLFQWQDGKKVIVLPEELAANQPRFPTPPWSQRP